MKSTKQTDSNQIDRLDQSIKNDTNQIEKGSAQQDGFRYDYDDSSNV